MYILQIESIEYKRIVSQSIPDKAIDVIRQSMENEATILINKWFRIITAVTVISAICVYLTSQNTKDTNVRRQSISDFVRKKIRCVFGLCFVNFKQPFVASTTAF